MSSSTIITTPGRGTAVLVAVTLVAAVSAAVTLRASCGWVFDAVTFSSTLLGASGFAELQKSCKSYRSRPQQYASMLEDRRAHVNVTRSGSSL
jgi:hypothetical protein